MKQIQREIVRSVQKQVHYKTGALKRVLASAGWGWGKMGTGRSFRRLLSSFKLENEKPKVRWWQKKSE